MIGRRKSDVRGRTKGMASLSISRSISKSAVSIISLLSSTEMFLIALTTSCCLKYFVMRDCLWSLAFLLYISINTKLRFSSTSCANCESGFPSKISRVCVMCVGASDNWWTVSGGAGGGNTSF